mmetsp:Transcript_41672/g.82484  ORF Transcript_41672/g.82484 Transcript_41672/m.82484 type:complete len:392 (+) Transcript_41672:72-1247(+)
MEAVCSSRVYAAEEMAQAFQAVQVRYEYDYHGAQYYTQQQQQQQQQQACTSSQHGAEGRTAGPVELRVRRPGGRPSSFEHWMAVAAPDRQSFAFAEAPPMSSYVLPKEAARPPMSSSAGAVQETKELTEPHGDVHHPQREEEPPVLLLNQMQAMLCEKGTREITAESLCRHLLQCCDLKGAIAQPAPEINLDAALDAIGAEQGVLNWALLDPVELDLHAAGTDGIEEMTKYLSEDRVLFGVLRLSFAVGSEKQLRGSTSRVEKRLERHNSTPYFAEADGPCRGTRTPCITRHIFVHWVGPAVSAVRRGQWNARCPQAMSRVAAHCAVVQRRTAHGLSDLRLDDIVEDLRRLTALGAADHTLGLGRISVDGYFAGLRQEAFMQHWLPGLGAV